MEQSKTDHIPTAAPVPLSANGRYLVLAAAFLGWAFSGVQMAVMNLASRSATEEFVRTGAIDSSGLGRPTAAGNGNFSETQGILKQVAPRWFARYNSAFLFGAAFGGLVFGWLGDSAGRVRAMAVSIVWYSAFAGLGYFARSPDQLLALRFL